MREQRGERRYVRSGFVNENWWGEEEEIGGERGKDVECKMLSEKKEVGREQRRRAGRIRW